MYRDSGADGQVARAIDSKANRPGFDPSKRNSFPIKNETNLKFRTLEIGIGQVARTIDPQAIRPGFDPSERNSFPSKNETNLNF